MDLSFYKGKKVFITGNTGFKGSWMCVLLDMIGAEIKGYSHEKYQLFEEADIDSITDTVIGDVCDLEKLSFEVNKFKPDIIFHLAAQPLVIEGYNDPVNTFNVNVMGTVNILEAARKCKSLKALVNVTTDKVYENKEWHWGYRENDRLMGRDPYSNSKSCSELVTHSYIKSYFENTNINLSTARAGNVIGGGDFAANRIIPDCAKAAIEKKTITIRNKTSIRPWQHVIEPIVAYLLLGQQLYEGTLEESSFNFGPLDSDCVDVGTLTDLFCTAWGEGAKWEHIPDKNAVHEATFLKLDCSLANAKLGWQPKWNIEKAINMCVQWYKEYSQGISAMDLIKKQLNEYLN